MIFIWRSGGSHLISVFDLIVETFNQLRKPLKIVGTGVAKKACCPGRAQY